MQTIKSENMEQSRVFATAAGEVEAEFAACIGDTSGAAAAAANQADSDAQLFSTLCEIDKHNYLYLFEKCKAYNVNARQLRYLEKEHIRRIIPADQIGILAEFEHFHAAWKKQLLVSNGAVNVTPMLALVEKTKDISKPATLAATEGNNNDSLSTLLGFTTTTNASLETGVIADRSLRKHRKRRCYSSSLDCAVEDTNVEQPVLKTSSQHSYSLDKIIARELRKVQLQYKKNGFLVERDRRLLAAVLVDYFLENKIYMSRDIMESLAIQISEIFPTESKNAWHDVSSHHRRRGRLCIKLYNTQRTKRATSKTYQRHLKEKYDLKESDADAEADETSQEELVVEEDDTEAQRIQMWLLENKLENDDELTSMWYETTNFRMKQMKRYEHPKFASTGSHIEEVFKSWPGYKSTVGSILINIDFNNIYLLSENIFYERWPLFQDRALRLCSVSLRDTCCLDLYKQYETRAPTLNEDTKNSIVMQMFHAILRPARPIHPRQNARRFAVNESQNAVSKYISDASEMQYYDEPFPFIFLVGNVFDVQRCYVAFKSARYELSFKEAFYTCFQIFTVFKLHFPLAAMNFWTFAQMYFFNITPEEGTNMTLLETTLNTILAPNYMKTF